MHDEEEKYDLKYLMNVTESLKYGSHLDFL
jgi:hypothetical protein